MSNTDCNLEPDYEELIKNDGLIDEHDPCYEKIFRDLQGGIIKNYGRNYYLYIFISFHKEKKEKLEDAKQWIREQITNRVTSTWMQLKDTEDYKKNIQRLKKQGFNSSLEDIHPGNLCINFFLSRKGYESLGINVDNDNNKKLSDATFLSGMKDWWKRFYCGKNSNDYNPPNCWDINGEHEIHALILLAHNSLDELKNEAALMMEDFERRKIGNIVACEVGYKLSNQHDRVVGPFGFVDNFSHPLFLKSDYERYCSQQGTDKWNPKASLSLILVKDPFVEEPYSFGSYCVWQKLETNYKRFKELENELAETLGCDQERAAALVVGRFRDGTPIALYPEERNQEQIENNFNYDDDRKGAKCPLHAHIRKVNPRGDRSTDKNDLSSDLEARKKHRIVRAGVTYFDDSKAQETSESKISQMCLKKLEHLKEVRQRSITDNIESISGLIFVCFQRSIVTQFQKLQLDWADNDKFPREFSVNEPKYLDPVIGHHITQTNQDGSHPQEWPKKWNENEDIRQEDSRPYLFYDCVKNKGGEFFFAPSISFLRKL